MVSEQINHELVGRQSNVQTCEKILTLFHLFLSSPFLFASIFPLRPSFSLLILFSLTFIHIKNPSIHPQLQSCLTFTHLFCCVPTASITLSHSKFDSNIDGQDPAFNAVGTGSPGLAVFHPQLNIFPRTDTSSTTPRYPLPYLNSNTTPTTQSRIYTK